MSNKNYLKDEGLDLLKTDLDNFMNTYLPNRLTEEKFEQLRYLDENINLTQEEFAKKLNNLGYRSYGEVPFNQRSVGRLDQKIGNIKRKSYTLAEQTLFLKNSLDPNEFKAIKDLNLPKDQEESLIRKRANSIRSRDARLNERGVFARGNSREAKLFANFYRAHTTSNRILIGGEFNGKDLSKRNKTGVVFTNKNISSAEAVGKLVKTSYYFMDYSKDIVGVEMCAAIKNFYSMVIGSAKDLNTAAILMQKSVIEMGKFIKLFGGSEQTVYGLAGLGDLYVSIAGGRNRKMGQHLGEGYSYSEAKKKFMPNDTVEGAELAFEIGPKILKDLSKKDFPIMYSLVESICKDKKFVINFL